MVIDIIAYTDEQYAAMTKAQLGEVRMAQKKKNRLLTDLEEDLRKEKYRLVKNGTYVSTIWLRREAELRERCAAAVEAVREELLFYLRFAAQEKEEANGYVLDYSLTLEERFEQVKRYYEVHWTDGTIRFEKFTCDEVARRYLGELYAPLYDYFLEDA